MTDSDGTVPDMWISIGPAAMDFRDNGDGSRTLLWSPQSDDIGTHTIEITAADANDRSLRSEVSFEINVLASNASDDSSSSSSSAPNAEPNQVPRILVSGSSLTEVGRQLTSLIRAVDPEGLAPSIRALNLPAGAELASNADGSYTLKWIPQLSDVGTHDLLVSAIDPQDASMTAERYVRLVVVESLTENRAPYFNPIEALTAQVEVALEQVVRPLDPEGIAPILHVYNAPSGVTFDDNLDGSRTFRWTPSESQVGEHDIRFVATDNDDTALSATTNWRVVVTP